MDLLHHHARPRSLSAASAGASPESPSPSQHRQHQQQQQQPDGRSRPQHSPRMATGHSPSPGPNLTADHVPSSSPSSLSLGLPPSQSQSFPCSQADFSTSYSPAAFDLSQIHQQPFPSQLPAGPGYGANGADFTIFPPSSAEPQFNAPLFVSDPDASNMMTRVASSSQEPCHLFKAESGLPSSATHSRSFAHHHFSSSPDGHSRHASLVPEAALLPAQLLDWNPGGPQFQGHRRSPSEYSDVSSAAPSPHLVTADNFDSVEQGRSPVNRPHDVRLYQELHGIGTFSLSDQACSPNRSARSPSHSPAMSPRMPPRIPPQQAGPDLSQPNGFLGLPQTNGFAPSSPYMQPPQEAFLQLAGDSDSEMQGAMPAPPSINIDYAPIAVKTGFEQPKTLDPDSLNPPERGRPRISRPRALTDPYFSEGALLSMRTPSAGMGLPPPSAVDGRAESSRSLSPLDRSGSGIGALSPSRRRQSTSAVPNNIIALRLVDPEYTGPSAQADTSGGGTKRVQKHPATFQCSLCPKRFTRAYNLRSHLRTHTDERPFVCTVCGKAFARQHDRKRHEGLHSGEKKFVCKGDLKAGGQWGCGRRFARADALGRHFRSEAGRVCIRPLLDEEMLERQRVWNEQQMQQAAAQGMVPGMMMSAPPPGMDPGAPFPMDASGNYSLPQALLAQYPALAQVNWSAPDMGGGSGMEDELSGRSSFDASDYDEADEAGYVSGPGTGFGPGGLREGFGEMGYASDYSGQ